MKEITYFINTDKNILVLNTDCQYPVRKIEDILVILNKNKHEMPLAETHYRLKVIFFFSNII